MRPPGVAVIAGLGSLPLQLADALQQEGRRYIVCAPHGLEVASFERCERFRYSHLFSFLAGLRLRNYRQLVMAGKFHRPGAEELADVEPASRPLAPAILPSLRQGDDTALRRIRAVIEGFGLQVCGIPEVAPALVPGAGVLGSVSPCGADRLDAQRAAAIVATLSEVDIGQACVVSQGQCLATEALFGTDVMLEWVAGSRHRLPAAAQGRSGVLYKAPKRQQDRRLDLPAIGPDTVAHAARAGLAGIAWEADGVIVVERAATVAAADAAGLFLWSCDPAFSLPS